MDLNGDGIVDVLSGSYSRQDVDMAGTFQVLWGSEDGFKVAETLNGTDDEPLIIPGGEADMMQKICTRPFACDIDADGDLDLVVGNFAGTFYLFTGEGEGKFDPEPQVMKTGKGRRLSVSHHSDPFMFDWDSDGDLDMVSGSSSGSVSLSINEGSASEAEFSKFEVLFKGVQRNFNDVTYGDEHLNGPQSDTRVWIGDVNGDGKFDLLVGDSTTITTIADGVDEEDVDDLLAEWTKEQMKISAEYSEFMQEYMDASNAMVDASDEDSEDEDSEDESSEEGDKESADDEAAEMKELDKKRDEFSEKLSVVHEKKSEIVNEDMTGFVWVYYQK